MLTMATVVPRPSRHLRLLPSRREALADTKRGSDLHRPDLDPVVPDHQAKKHHVHLPLPSPILPFPLSHTFQSVVSYPANEPRLASVNFFLGLVGVVQVSRIVMYNSSQKKLTAGEQIEAAKEGAVESAKGLKGDVVEAVKS